MILLDDRTKEQLNDEGVLMQFKTGRHNNFCVFFTYGFYELPKDTFRENSSAIHPI